MKSLSGSLRKRRSGKHNSQLVPRLALLLVVLPASVLLADWIGDTRPLMGTEVSVYLWSDDAEQAQTAVASVFEEAARIDRLMSTYKEDSEISEINRLAATRPVVAGDELFSLVQRSLDISVLTLGAFDITYDSVGQHYDFRSRQRPDSSTVETERENIDYRFVQLDRAAGTRCLSEKDGVRINLGGIAKGYVVERGVDILRRLGVEHAIVTAGGDSRLLGDRRGRPWMVGIRDPRVDGQVSMSVPLADEAISTSGDYERFFDEDGVRYHHIIEPGSRAAGKLGTQRNGYRARCRHDGCIVDLGFRHGRRSWLDADCDAARLRECRHRCRRSRLLFRRARKAGVAGS